MIRLMGSNYSQPVNIGNPEEYTVKAFAEVVSQITNSSSKIAHLPQPEDDPTQRRPDITRALNVLGWEPKFGMRQGLLETIQYFK